MASTITRAQHIRYQSSEGDKFNMDTTLVAVTCATCGILYAIPESLESSAHRYKGDTPNGWKLVCPLGHEWWYVGETEVQRQRRLVREAREDADRQRARAGQMAAQRDQAQAQARAEKAAKTRIKNSRQRERARVAAGVCPCCNRSFKNLARHMKSQHPHHVEDPPHV